MLGCRRELVAAALQYDCISPHEMSQHTKVDIEVFVRARVWHVGAPLWLRHAASLMH